MNKLPKIISGFQNGVDIAAIEAAKELGYSTGGWMPRGYRTLDGPKDEYARMYGAQDSGGGYRDRTSMNVQDADITIRYAYDYSSPGELCTARALRRHKKANIDIDASTELPIEEVLNFIFKYSPKRINFAGNSEHTAPGIHDKAKIYFTKLLTELKRIIEDKQKAGVELLKNKKDDETKNPFKEIKNRAVANAMASSWMSQYIASFDHLPVATPE